jgi:hypothetical protein
MDIVEKVKTGEHNIALGRATKIGEKVKSGSGKVVRCFMNVDMRNGLEGLKKIASDEKIDVDKLAAGEYVVFINSSKSKIKMYATTGVLAQYAAQKGEVIDLRTIAKIPAAFNTSGRIDYDKVLKQTIEEALYRKVRRKAVEERSVSGPS